MTIIVAGGGYGGYYPWGYGGLGFGSYYGYYDPGTTLISRFTRVAVTGMTARCDSR
jgi:hypothetical protein